MSDQREFIVSCEFQGGKRMFGIWADSLEDAARRVRAIRENAVLIGSAEKFTPVEIEYRGERTKFNPDP